MRDIKLLTTDDYRKPCLVQIITADKHRYPVYTTGYFDDTYFHTDSVQDDKVMHSRVRSYIPMYELEKVFKREKKALEIISLFDQLKSI